MTAITQEVTKEMIIDVKNTLKELAAEQKKEKSLLRMPHYEIPEVEITTNSGYKFKRGGIDRAGSLQYSTMLRAEKITSLHITYNKMRGKPTNMHEYKK
jgi:hypothetical protein